MSKIVLTRSRTKINHGYYILDDKLVEVNTICVIGVIFQTNLSFSFHIKKSYTKALKSFGFLIRCTEEFNDELCLNILNTYITRQISLRAAVPF